MKSKIYSPKQTIYNSFKTISQILFVLYELTKSELNKKKSKNDSDSNNFFLTKEQMLEAPLKKRNIDDFFEKESGFENKIKKKLETAVENYYLESDIIEKSEKFISYLEQTLSPSENIIYLIENNDFQNLDKKVFGTKFMFITFDHVLFLYNHNREIFEDIIRKIKDSSGGKILIYNLDEEKIKIFTKDNVDKIFDQYFDHTYDDSSEDEVVTESLKENSVRVSIDYSINYFYLKLEDCSKIIYNFLEEKDKEKFQYCVIKNIDKEDKDVILKEILDSHKEFISNESSLEAIILNDRRIIIGSDNSYSYVICQERQDGVIWKTIRQDINRGTTDDTFKNHLFLEGVLNKDKCDKKVIHNGSCVAGTSLYGILFLTKKDKILDETEVIKSVPEYLAKQNLSLKTVTDKYLSDPVNNYKEMDQFIKMLETSEIKIYGEKEEKLPTNNNIKLAKEYKMQQDKATDTLNRNIT